MGTRAGAPSCCASPVVASNRWTDRRSSGNTLQAGCTRLRRRSLGADARAVRDSPVPMRIAGLCCRFPGGVAIRNGRRLHIPQVTPSPAVDDPMDCTPLADGLPEELPVLALREFVVFPYMVLPLRRARAFDRRDRGGDGRRSTRPPRRAAQSGDGRPRSRRSLPGRHGRHGHAQHAHARRSTEGPRSRGSARLASIRSSITGTAPGSARPASAAMPRAPTTGRSKVRR